MNSAIIALIGTIFGGAGLKVIEALLNRSKNKMDERKSEADIATGMREELRKEVASLKDELRRVEGELDTWRQKYYDLLEQFIQVKNSLDASLVQIRAETKALRDNTGEIPAVDTDPVT